MSKLKQKLFRGLIAFLLAGAFLFPKESKAQERVIIDNFSQPNDSTLNYYGMPDLNNDNLITWEDANRLDSLIQRTFSNPLDDRLTDKADINGDKVINNQDKTILKNYLNEDISYLPAHWNQLDNSEKQDWFEKMKDIDKTDTIPPIFGEWECGEFATQTCINFYGFESLANGVGDAFPYKFSQNNRFNIPICYVSTRSTSGKSHFINGVLIGDNPLNFNDQCFIEPQTDNQVNPGDASMAYDSKVKINYIWNIDKNTGAKSLSNIIIFDLDENGNPTLDSFKPYIVLSNPNKDIIPPEVNLSIKDSIYNSNVDLEYLVRENQTFLDSAYYELNGIRKNIECSIPYYSGFIGTDSISGTEFLTSEEGEHNLVFYANDIAKPQGNATIEERTFILDKTPPTTFDDIPAEWQNSDFDVTLIPSDALSGVASTKYCISSTNDCTPDIEYTSPVSITEEGEKYFRYFSTDSAKNNQPIVSKVVKLDKTTPEPSIIYPESKDYVGGVDSMVVSISDANLDNNSCWYSTDNGLSKEYFSCNSGEQKTVYPSSIEGSNIWTVGAGDYATNTSEESVTFNILPDAVEKQTLEDYFKVYPNPVSSNVNFEFYLEKPQDIRLSFYDASGRELEKRVFNGSQGENRIYHDVSKYSQGIVLYRFETSDGSTKNGKLIKK